MPALVISKQLGGDAGVIAAWGPHLRWLSRTIARAVTDVRLGLELQIEFQPDATVEPGRMVISGGDLSDIDHGVLVHVAIPLKPPAAPRDFLIGAVLGALDHVERRAKSEGRRFGFASLHEGIDRELEDEALDPGRWRII